MSLALGTDLYQITMAAAYYHQWGAEGCRHKLATFDLFVRSLPPGWNYLVACGIDEALQALRDVWFTDGDIDYLRSLDFRWPKGFLDYLRDWRFEGAVFGVAEGTIIFPNEPILEVRGGIIETQLVETMLLSIINYQTLIASKASRIVAAADSLPVIDFGLRRAPGLEAGVRAARAAYIGGVVATSNLEAGRRYGIPVRGTHAHSYVMAHATEYEAFVAWCRAHPEPTTLLIDTYDVEQGARNVVRAVKEAGCRIEAVRIDSGNLHENTRVVRSIFNQYDLKIRILVSGDLNEQKIADLRASGASIDGFGVGTDLVAARPEAALGGVYKLVELDNRPKIKLSPGKITWPGCKQVWRCCQSDGKWHDEIRLVDERLDDDEHVLGTAFPLLNLAMSSGQIVAPSLSTQTHRECRRVSLERIRDSIGPDGYVVEVSPRLREQFDAAKADLEGGST